MDWRFHFQNTTFGILSRWFAMLGNDVHTFYDYTALIHQHLFYNAWFTCVFIITGDHYYFIAFPDIELRFKSCFHFILLSQLRDFFLLSAFSFIHLLFRLRRTPPLFVLYSSLIINHSL